jgi:hypothetical protein
LRIVVTVDSVNQRTVTPPSSWRHRVWPTLTSLLFGAAFNVLANVLSNDYRYRIFLALLIAGIVAAATTWLRRLPPRAPIVRYLRAGLLCAALGLDVVAAAGPTAWVGPVVVAAGCLVGVAVFIIVDLREFTRTLFGAALAGLAIAQLQSGIESLQAGGWLSAMQMLGAAPLGIFSCLAIILDNYKLRRVGLGVMQLVCIAIGLVSLVFGDLAGYLNFVFAAFVAHYFHRRAVKDMSKVHEVIPGVLFAAPSTLGSPGLRRFVDRRMVIAIGMGLIFLFMATSAFAVEKPLNGVVFVAGGVACLIRGAQLAPHGDRWPAMRRRLLALMRDPDLERPIPVKDEECMHRLASMASSGGEASAARRKRPSNAKRRRGRRR